MDASKIYDFGDTSRNQEKMIFGCVPKISEEGIQESIKKILSFEDNTVLYPGHSVETSVSEERENYI